MAARPICLRLLVQRMRAAASRTFWTAGSSRPIRMAMMAMTTRSSISVNPGRRVRTDMCALRTTERNDEDERRREDDYVRSYPVWRGKQDPTVMSDEDR